MEDKTDLGHQEQPPGAALAADDKLHRDRGQLEREVAERTEALRYNAERLGILHEIDQSILAARLPETIALAAIARIRRLVPYHRALVLATEEGQGLRVLAVHSVAGFRSQADPALYGELVNKPLLASGQVYGVEDLGAIEWPSALHQALYGSGIHAYMVVPLRAQDELVGMLNLESSSPRSFTADHVTIAREVAASLAVAIRQASLHARLEQELEERMKAEAALQRRTAALETRNAELNAFAHTVAHDLKNPLTTVLGYAEVLRYQRQIVPDEMQEQYLTVIARGARKMITIVDELLLLASVQAQDNVPCQPLDMHLIVSEALGGLRHLAEETGGTVVLPESWPVAIGHAPWVEEIWANYISNGLKYGGQPPRVELGADAPGAGAQPGLSTTQLAAHPMVRFWVRDNGQGLGAAEQARLFTPFERLHQERVQGHGLGLSIVQRIIRKLGGQVGVDSSGQPGQGCTFYFTLPAGTTPESP